MAQSERIRVAVGDPAPLNRALARHFLEEDGFEVVGDAAQGPELLELVGRQRPDAVVLDEQLTGGGPLDLINPLKESSPDTKIVVLASHPERKAPAGADATLEKGVGLSNLSPVLRRLCGMGVVGVVGRGYTPAARIRQGPLEELRTLAAGRQDRRLVMRIGAVAATLAILSALALVLVRAPSPEPVDRVEPSPPATSPPPVVVVENDGGEFLAAAMGDFGDLLAAVHSGDRGLALRIARELMANRAAALAAGADVGRLDHLIQGQLWPLLGLRDPIGLVAGLEGIFGALLPPIDIGPLGGGPEETVVLGTGGGGSGGGGDGDGGGGNHDGDKDGDGDDHDGDGDGDGDGFPGQGHHYGWANKPPKGGWHHGQTKHQ